MPRAELFVGNLTRDITRKDMEDVFDKYGKMLKCEVKNKDNGSSFCFIEFEEERDAEEALRAENGRDMLGSSMKIEWAKGKERRGGRDGDRGRGGFRDRRGGRDGGRDGGAPRNLECFKCGERGHFARDCRSSGGTDRYSGSSRRGGDRREGGGRRDYERRRERSRSRSRS